jgi:hypothetical protein
VWGFIGEKETEVEHGREKTVYHLFTHYIFSIHHNGEHIVEASRHCISPHRLQFQSCVFLAGSFLLTAG